MMKVPGLWLRLSAVKTQRPFVRITYSTIVLLPYGNYNSKTILKFASRLLDEGEKDFVDGVR
jgi:hypothetical protein